MEVILQTEVVALGREGDIVKVARGYANNYLIPQGMAVLANKGNLKHLEERRAGIEKRHAAARSEAQAQADKFNGKSLTISAKAGEEGRLFGSVTAKDIAAAIKENFDVEVDRRRMIPADPIKEAGEVTIRVRLSADVEASLVVKVVAEVAEVAEVTEAAEEAAEAVDTSEESSDGADTPAE